MKIKDRPEYNAKPKPLTLQQDEPVSKAIDMMNERSFGSVIIVDAKDSIVGIVTERDFLTRLLPKKLDPQKTKLSEIMTKDVRVAREDDDLLDWLRIMSNERFRHLPVVNDNGDIVNMMSQGDFVSYTWPELFDRFKENAKASIANGYQIPMIIGAMLLYALLVPALSKFF